jgi:hypothetical protein
MFTVGAVAVAVVLLAVLLTGLGGFGSGTTPSGNPVTSAAAERAAAPSPPSPPWLLDEVLGLDMWNATTLPLNASQFPANCTLSPPPSLLPSSINPPLFRGNISTGAAVFWILEYVQPSTNTSMVILVENGVAKPLFTMSGATCVVVPSGFTGLPPGLVDSGIAAQAIDQDGGSSFLATHRAGTSLAMFLLSLPGLYQTGQYPRWEFLYTPCSILSPTPTGPSSAVNFVASVNATSGVVVSANATNIDCQQNLSAPPPSIFAALSLGNPQLVQGAGTGGTIANQGCNSGDYCYKLTVGNATGGVEPQDFALSVDNASGAPTSVPVGYAVLNPQGQVLVYSLGARETTWTPDVGNATTPLALGSTIWVDMGTTDPIGQNYFLAIQGQGPYVNSGGGYGLP